MLQYDKSFFMNAIHSANDSNQLHEHPSSNGMNMINVPEKERLISVAIGSFMLAGALWRRPVGMKNVRKGLVGSFLLYRGLTGSCPLYHYLGKEGAKTRAINLRVPVVVNKPVAEVYASWRKLENLPSFMQHLKEVKETDEKHSHWKAAIPGDMGEINWDAKIVKEEPGRLLVWESVKDSMIENAGKVEFSEALGGHGTLVDVMITYRAPGGNIGRSISHLFSPYFRKVIKDDIMAFKQFAEKEETSSAS